MAGNVLELTEDSFDEVVLKSKIPVLVDFWAPWCGPCKSIAPLIDEVAVEFQGKLLVAKMNVDNNAMTAKHYNIRTIPNLIFFKDGKVVDQVATLVPKEQLVATINRVI